MSEIRHLVGSARQFVADFRRQMQQQDHECHSRQSPQLQEAVVLFPQGGSLRTRIQL